MNLIILPGNSPLHKTWTPIIHELILRISKETLKALFEEIVEVSYDHWETNQPLLNFDLELEKVVKLVNTEKFKSNNYAIFAKSVGTLITLKGIFDKNLNPAKCVFLGVPLTFAKENKYNYEAWLKNYSVETLFIQQKDDPYCSFEDLKTQLQNLNVTNFSLKEVEGNNHHYDNYSEIKELVKSLL